MKASVVELGEAEHAALNAFLDARIYEFNAQATGFDDGKSLGCAVRTADGRIVAGVTGHTWGGTCYVTYLWVHAERRRTGVGSELLRTVESVARRRGCTRILLGTHGFQAPRFYERHGFERVAEILDYPQGHSQLFYAKPLAAASREEQP